MWKLERKTNLWQISFRIFYMTAFFLFEKPNLQFRRLTEHFETIDCPDCQLCPWIFNKNSWTWRRIFQTSVEGKILKLYCLHFWFSNLLYGSANTTSDTFVCLTRISFQSATVDLSCTEPAKKCIPLFYFLTDPVHELWQVFRLQ